MPEDIDIVGFDFDFDNLIGGLKDVGKAVEGLEQSFTKSFGTIINNVEKTAKATQTLMQNQAKMFKMAEVKGMDPYLKKIEKLDDQTRKVFEQHLPQSVQKTLNMLRQLDNQIDADTPVVSNQDLSNIQRANGLLEQFVKQQRKAQQEASKIDFEKHYVKPIGEASKQTKTFSDMLGGLGKKLLATFSVITVIRGVANAIRGALNAAMEFNDVLHSLRVTLQGIAAVNNQATAGIEAQMTSLMKLANHMNTSMSDMLGASQEMASILQMKGIPIDNLEKFVEIAIRLGTLATGPMGGTKGAIFAISEMLSGDYVSLLKRFNIAQEEVFEIMEREGVSAIEALDIKLDETGRTLNNAAEANRTFAGTMTKLKDSFAFLSAQAFAPMLAGIEEIAHRLSNAIFQAGMLVKTFSENTSIFTTLRDIVVETFSSIGSIIESTREIRTTLTEIINSVLHSIFGPMISIADILPKITEPIKQTAITLVSVFGTLSIVLQVFEVSLKGINVAVQALKVAFLQASKVFYTDAKKKQEIDEQIAQATLDREAAFTELETSAFDAADSFTQLLETIKEIQTFEFPEITPYEEIELDLPEEAFEFSGEAIEEYQKFQEEERQLIEDHEKAKQDLLDDFNKDNERRLEDFNTKQEQAREDFDRDREQDLKKHRDKIADIESGKDSEAEKLIQKRREQTKTKIIKYNNDLEDLEDAHNKRLEKIQQDAKERIQDAAANLDAIAVRKAIEQRDKRIAEENAKFEEQKAKLKERLDEEISLTTESFQEQLRIARQHDAQRIADLKKEFAEEQKLKQEEFDLKQLREKERFDLEQKRRDEDLADKLKAMDEAHAQELQKMREKFVKRLMELAEHNEAIVKINRQAYEQIEKDLIDWWNNNADLYLPPEFEAEKVVDEEKDKGKAGSDIIGPGGIVAFAEGGDVTKTGAALVHQGERVLTKSTSDMLRNALGPNFSEQNLLRSIGGQQPSINTTSITKQYDLTVNAGDINNEIDFKKVLVDVLNKEIID
jgi:hypothetical protein